MNEKKLKETKKWDNEDILHNIMNGFNDWDDFNESGKNKIIKQLCKRVIELERKMGLCE